jgi:nitrate/TMAO reductase-like tetraheme cytochrome c subunit
MVVALFPLGVAVEPVVPLPQEIDPVVVWLQRLSVGSALIGIALVVILMLARTRLSETVLKVACVAVYVLLPVLVIAMGNVVGLAQAKKVEFCHSCHLTMGPFVNDMQNPGSATLAAQHFRNRWSPEDQCYACHASYGLFGDVRAKRKGLEDFLKYYTGTYHLPVRMHAPYPNAECLKCHDRTPKFLESETHRQALAQIRSDEFRCIECHGPAHAEPETHANSFPR